MSDKSGMRATTRKTSREDQDDNGEGSKLFSSLISSDVVLYLEKRFERLEAEPVVWFKMFDKDKWSLDSASLKLFGNKTEVVI